MYRNLYHGAAISLNLRNYTEGASTVYDRLNIDITGSNPARGTDR